MSMYGHPREEELMRLLDGDPAIVYAAAEHVEECADCQRRLDSIRAFRAALGEVLGPKQDKEAKKAALLAKIEQDAQRAKQISSIVDKIIGDANIPHNHTGSKCDISSAKADVSQETGHG